MEEEEYKAFLEREVGEDLHNFVTVGTNEAVGTSEDAEVVGDSEKGKKKKKGKKEREKEKEENGLIQSKKAIKKRDKKPKEEADQEFLMKCVFRASNSPRCCPPLSCRDTAN